MAKYTWSLPGIEKLGASEAYGKAMIQFAEQNKNIIVLAADLMSSNKTGEFARTFPDRFFNFGVAEQDMVGAAAGLALSGKIPFAGSFACFLSMRACEQVRTDIAYNNLPVRIVATHAGVSFGEGGTTHHATEDLAIMRSFANMTVITPADATEMVEAVSASIDYPGPIYFRVSRKAEPPVYKPGYRYEIGKADTLREGHDATAIACGIAVHAARDASLALEKEGISLRVLNVHTLKPIDAQAIIKAAKETGAIVTAEDHNIIGGLGGAVAEVLADAGIGVAFKRLGLPDVYSDIGPPKELYQRYGIDADGIAAGVREVLKKKSR